jgi:hypothetical protein
MRLTPEQASGTDTAITVATPWQWSLPDYNGGQGSPGRPELPPAERTSRARKSKLKRVHHTHSQAPSTPRAGCTAPSSQAPGTRPPRCPDRKQWQ